MTKSLAQVAKQVLKESAGNGTSNSDTLKPGSKHKDPMPQLSANPSNVPVDKGADLGTGPVKVGDDNPDATGAVAKDKSKSSQKSSGEPFAVGKNNVPPKAPVANTKETPETNDGEKFGVNKGNTPPEFAWKKGELDEEIFNEELEAYVTELIEAGLNEEEIHEELDKLFESDEQEEVNEEKKEKEDDKDDDKEDDKDDDDKDDMNESTLPVEIDVSEDIAAMFNGQELSEEFKKQASEIFEAAIRSRLNEYQKILDEEFEKAITEATDSIEEGLEEKVTNYLTYVTEQWMAENEVAIESSLRTELTEDFMVGLRNLFMENNMDIPEEKLDVIEELSLKVEELQSRLDEEIENNVTLNNALNESVKAVIVTEMTSGLTDTQAEKIRSLSEGVEFTDEETFKGKLSMIKENYFPASKVKNDSSLLTESEVSDDPKKSATEELQGPMARYSRAISRTLPK